MSQLRHCSGVPAVRVPTCNPVKGRRLGFDPCQPLAAAGSKSTASFGHRPWIQARQECGIMTCVPLWWAGAAHSIVRSADRHLVGDRCATPGSAIPGGDPLIAQPCCCALHSTACLCSDVTAKPAQGGAPRGGTTLLLRHRTACPCVLMVPERILPVACAQASMPCACACVPDADAPDASCNFITAWISSRHAIMLLSCVGRSVGAA